MKARKERITATRRLLPAETTPEASFVIVSKDTPIRTGNLVNVCSSCGIVLLFF